MKNTNSFTPTNTTPSQHEGVKMDISKEGSKYLIANLTNLYTHPEVAVLREYTANALDSHIKAGQTTKPILVNIIEDTTLDNGLSNRYRIHKPYTISVEDFGLGMDKNDIIHIYSQYGASTKRDTNTQVGAFGLGAKSGLAVADSFTLQARKNGVQLDCVVRKDEDGVGIIDFVNEEPTTEPDGVKVSIHVTKTNTNLLEAASKFFATWEVGSILINGNEPYHLDTDPKFIKVKISDSEVLGWIETSLVSREAYYVNNSSGYISMGGITYNISYSDREPYREAFTGFDKIFGASYVNTLIGSIDLTPPREGIRFSQKTVTTLKNTFENFIEFGRETLQNHINHLGRKEAILFYNANRGLINAFWGKNPNNVNHDTVVWNNESFDTAIVLSPTDVTSSGEKIFYEMIYPKSAGLNRTPLDNYISALEILVEDKNTSNATSHFVTMNLTQDNLTETWFTRNIRDYAKHILNGEANICVIATNDTVNSNVWIDALAPKLDSETMIAGARAFRSSKTKTVRPVKEVTYYAYNRSDIGNITTVKTSELTGKKMLYVEKTEGLFPDRLWQDIRANNGRYSSFNTTYHSEFFTLFNSILSNYEGIIFLDGKSPRPLIKLHPQMDSFSAVVEKLFTDLDDVHKMYAGVYVNLIERSAWSLANLKSNCEKIVDENIVSNITDERFQNLVQYFGTMNALEHAKNQFIAANKVKNYRTTVYGMFNILEVAPLLISNVSNPEHFVAYVNAINFDDKSDHYEVKTQPYRYYQ